jgi:hypothetical protein
MANKYLEKIAESYSVPDSAYFHSNVILNNDEFQKYKDAYRDADTDKRMLAHHFAGMGVGASLGALPLEPHNRLLAGVIGALVGGQVGDYVNRKRLADKALADVTAGRHDYHRYGEFHESDGNLKKIKQST